MEQSSTVSLGSESTHNVVTLDDMLVFMGEFGLYQKLLFMVMMPFLIFYSFIYFTQFFITITPEEYWCSLPNYQDMPVHILRDLVIPKIDKVPHEEHGLPYSRCWIYDEPIEQIVSAGEVQSDWSMKKCDKWDFNYTAESVPYPTITSEQGWVCGRDYFVNLAQSLFFVGAILGGFLFGKAADKYGRIPVLLGTAAFGFVGGICTIFSTEFWHFCVSRFIVGFAYDNIYVMAYILVLEFVGPKWRTFVANMSYGIFFTLGLVIMPLMAYYIADWKLFTLVTTLPLLLVGLTPWIVPESVRWLIAQGDIETTVKILERIENVNKSPVDQVIYEDFLDDCVKTSEALDREQCHVLDLFKTPRLRTITLLLVTVWAIIAMAYDGHIRCIDHLGHNPFTTFTISAATELPAVILIIFILDVIGRRWSLFSTLVLSGLAAFVAASVPIGIYFASFAMIGRFFMSIGTNVGLQYVAELLPTVVRGEGVAFIHITGFVTSILSPFVAYTNVIQYNMPMIILGTVSIVAAILCLFLPETLKEELPQTLFDGEQFGKDQNFWDNPLKKRFAQTTQGRHFLHAQRPLSRGAMLRSSMISGYTGNERRLKALRANIELNRIVHRNKTALAQAGSPTEYVRLLREGYRHSRGEKSSTTGQAKEEETPQTGKKTLRIFEEKDEKQS